MTGYIRVQGPLTRNHGVWGFLKRTLVKTQDFLVRFRYYKQKLRGLAFSLVGVRIRGTLGDIDPLNKVPLREPQVRFRRVPFKGSP